MLESSLVETRNFRFEQMDTSRLPLVDQIIELANMLPSDSEDRTLLLHEAAKIVSVHFNPVVICQP